MPYRSCPQTYSRRPPSRGRGLKCNTAFPSIPPPGRPPSRGRGLKFADAGSLAYGFLSPPLAGAWIEMRISVLAVRDRMSPPLAGAWIEILKVVILPPGEPRRPPSRGRGLKCIPSGSDGAPPWSPPLAGAWIEISLAPEPGYSLGSRPPPSRGAWIEIAVFFSRRRIFSSRPLAGGVD